MPKFKKIVLREGTYISPDGEIVITKDRMNHWASNFINMKKAGLKIPIPWGHLSKVNPEGKEYLESKFNSGFLDKLHVNSNGELEAVLDIPRTADAEKIGTIVQEVSPQIETAWRDGKGRIWNDVITHLALVTHPVIPGQENFEAIDDELPENAVRLSLKMRNDNMFEKKDKDKNASEATTEKKEEKKDVSEGKEVEKKVGHEGGSSTHVDQELLDILADIGLVLPDDTNDKNLPERLKTSALTLKGNMDKMGGGGQDFQQLDLGDLEKELGQQQEQGKQPEMEQPQTPPKAQEQQPQMQMSLNKEVQRLSLVERKLADSIKTGLKSRIQALLVDGKITPVIAQKLDAQLKIYKLSLRDDGTEDESPLVAQIENFELMPKGSAWSDEQKIRLKNAVEQDLPSEFKEMSDADADKLAEAQLKTRFVSYEF